MSEERGYIDPYTPVYTPGEGSDMAIFLSDLSNYRIINKTFYFRIKIPSRVRNCFISAQYLAAEILRSLHVELPKTSETDPKRIKVPAIVKRRIDELVTNAKMVFYALESDTLLPEVRLDLVKRLLPSHAKPEITAPVSRGKLLSEVIAEYVKNAQQNKCVVKSMYEIKFSLRLAKEIIGDKPIQDVTREDTKNFKETLLLLPPKFTESKRFRGMPIEQVLAAGPHVKTMTSTTVNNKIGWLSSLFLYAIQEGYYLGQNPAQKLKLKRLQKANKDKRQYTKVELQRIFSNLQWNKKRPERFWVPIVGLFHGVRLNQICQLYLRDVIIDDVSEVWCFNFNDDAEDQSIKSNASRRCVPIHPFLIDLGFLHFVEYIRKQGHPRLFMNLYLAAGLYSHGLSKWFTEKFNPAIIEGNPNPKKATFHSLRHNFCNYLKQKRINMPLISALAGHENEGIENDTSMTNVRYTEAYEPSVLIPVIKQLDYEIVYDMKNLVIQVRQCMQDIGVVDFTYEGPVPDYHTEYLEWEAKQPLVEDYPEEGDLGYNNGGEDDSGEGDDGIPF